MDADEYRRMAEAGKRHWWYASTRSLLQQLLADQLDRSDVALYLDAGGGTGATGGWLTRIAPTVLADYEPTALGVAHSDFPAYRPVQADLNSLPFGDGVFSAVLCVTALCHRMNPDPAAVVEDFARITRPGGLVCIMEPGGKRLRRGHDDVTHTARRFSVTELREMAERAGLAVVRATGAYSFLLRPAALLGVVERGRSKSDIDRNETGLHGALGLLARAERKLLARRDLPFGLSAIVLARRPP